MRIFVFFLKKDIVERYIGIWYVHTHEVLRLSSTMLIHHAWVDALARHGGGHQYRRTMAYDDMWFIYGERGEGGRESENASDYFLPPLAASFFLGNLSWPISWPLSLTFKTRSMAERSFWSGMASPFSYDDMTLAVVLQRVARSFCDNFGSVAPRRWAMICPTLRSTVFGFTMSSARSTLVRCLPSVPDG